MARRRRKYKISGDEYTFGGGASGVSADTGTLRIRKGNPYTNSANFDGILTDGDTVTIKMDAGTSIVAKDQYVYFDNAFETNTGSFEMTYEDGATALPSGVSYTSDNDSTDTDTGYFRFYGTPSTEGESKFKVRYYDNAGTEAFIYYTLIRFPAGTTPVWSGTLPSQIIRNVSDAQVLIGPATTTQTDPAPYYSLKDVTGFATGVTPVVDSATGEVTVSNVGDIVQSASSHSFTIVANLGSEVGTFENTFTGNISYGDPSGQLYVGPASISSYSTPLQLNVNYNETGAGSGGNYANTTPYPNSNHPKPITGGQSNSQGYLSNQARWSSGGRNYDGSYYYDWTVPNGVTTFCAVAVGGGAGGCYSWSAYGGGGAGMAWVNDITCTPGEVFRLYIGMPGSVTSSNTTSNSVAGGKSYIVRMSNNENILTAYGGGGYNYHGNAGNVTSHAYTQNAFTSDQWNPGSASASTAYGTYGVNYGGYSDRSGGGAAGYTGKGGDPSQSGSGGGGAGGQNYSSTYGYPAGGGVGLDGQGNNGDTGSSYSGNDYSRSYYYSGGGGSGGHRGRQAENPFQGNAPFGSQATHGGEHGGGAGGSGTSWGGGYGAMGGVRIIWGTGRSYPNNALSI